MSFIMAIREFILNAFAFAGMLLLMIIVVITLFALIIVEINNWHKRREQKRIDEYHEKRASENREVWRKLEAAFDMSINGTTMTPSQELVFERIKNELFEYLCFGLYFDAEAHSRTRRKLAQKIAGLVWDNRLPNPVLATALNLILDDIRTTKSGSQTDDLPVVYELMHKLELSENAK